MTSEVDSSAIAANVAAVRERIARAATDASRDPAAIRLVAATKTQSVDAVRAAIAAGVDAVGENRAQELLDKAPVLAAAGGDEPTAPWHFIGQLQRRKVRALAPWVAIWESVDRVELGAELARHAPHAVVFVQVNIGDEPQKGGCARAETADLVAALRDLGLTVAGLMAVPPHGMDPVPYFQDLVALADALDLAERSIGMSEDYEIAVAHGATTVRVGRAIFGER